MGTDEIGILEVERDAATSTRRVWLKRENVDDRLSRRETVAAAIRIQTPGWLAALRFCYPDRRVWGESHLEISPSGRRLDCPGHRSVYSRRTAASALPALELLISDASVRASLYWLSLAYQIWGESIAHASGMVWMSLESLVGDGGITTCATAYINRLQSQLAADIDQTLGTLAGDAVARRKKGWPAPRWTTGLSERRVVANDQAWLAELVGSAAAISHDPGVKFVLSDAASLNSGAREAMLAQTVVDLRLLRSARHAIAHTGKAIAEEPLLHYLATLGCECIRALLSQRLDGTSYEGILDGRPLLLAQCEVVNDHAHPFYIPAWVTNHSQAIYPSMFVESERTVGHRHELTLTQEHRVRLAAGEQTDIVTSVSEGHCHTVSLQNRRKPERDPQHPHKT
jgi:hypothetical protein